MRVFRSAGPAASFGKIYLRLPRHADGPAWIRQRRQSRDFLEPWEPRWQPDHLERNSFRRRVRAVRKLAEERKCWAYLVFRASDDELLGGLSIENRRGWPAGSASLGYWIGELHSRQGYMRDAVEAAIRHAFTNLGVSRIEAACVPENVASRRLLLSCGFHREGTARAYLEIDGKWRDHELYARMVPERVDPLSGKSR